MVSLPQRGFGRLVIETFPGFKKIYEIESIGCAVSCWGRGWVSAETFERNCFWIEDFIIDRQSDYNSIHEFASLLASEMNNNENIPLISPPTNRHNLHPWLYGTSGAHVVGYVDFDGGQLPVLYHVHNGISQVFDTIDPTIVNANYDLSPERVRARFDNGEWPLHRNGDFMMYAVLDAMLNDLFSNLRRTMLPTGDMFTIPEPRNFGRNELRSYSNYIAFWIKLVRDIHRLSNLPNSIGGSVQITTVTSEEINQIQIEDEVDLLNFRLISGEISLERYNEIITRISSSSE